MTRTLKLLFPLLWWVPCLAQVSVSPIVQPHMVFNNSAGLACAGCSLFTYAAGSTTPQATYTDSTGTVQNTNPVILGADGGPLTSSGSAGAIWLGTLSYKFVLIDSLGNTVFSVDNITSGGLSACTTAGAVTFENNSLTGLSCDPNITISTSSHTINVGSLPTLHVTIGALGTPTSWTFDTTTPATALASLGAGSIGSGTVNQIAIYPTSGNNVQGSSSVPDGISVLTRSPNDQSGFPASTLYVLHPGDIEPNSVAVAGGTPLTANQGNGASVQHSTGATTTGDCVKYDANGNTVDSGWPCTPTTSTTLTDVTGSRSFGATFQNTSGHNMYVSGWATTHGSDTIQLSCAVGASSPTTTEWSAVYGATISSGTAGFSCFVPPNYFYSVTAGMSGLLGLGGWVETTF